jgi:hypothetical protein
MGFILIFIKCVYEYLELIEKLPYIQIKLDFSQIKLLQKCVNVSRSYNIPIYNSLEPYLESINIYSSY